jgi:hypothetical protein
LPLGVGLLGDDVLEVAPAGVQAAPAAANNTAAMPRTLFIGDLFHRNWRLRFRLRACEDARLAARACAMPSVDGASLRCDFAEFHT